MNLQEFLTTTSLGEVVDLSNNLCERSFEEMWEKNLMSNWEKLKAARGIRKLWGSMEKSRAAAVICGAGPSLESALPILRDNPDKFAVIAVDASYDRVRAFGIRPLLTVTLDAQAAVDGFFARHEPGDLVALTPFCTPSLMDRIPADDIVVFTSTWHTEFWDRIIRDWFGGNENYFGWVLPGGAVGTTATAIAGGLWFHTIAFAGVDLCCDEERPEWGKSSIRVVDADGRLSWTVLAYLLSAYGIQDYAKVANDIRFARICPGGLLGALPYVPPAEMAESLKGDPPDIRTRALRHFLNIEEKP